MKLDHCLDADGDASRDVLQYAILNAVFPTGLANPLDTAVAEAGSEGGMSAEGWSKLAEIPYDFVRKCMSVVVEHAERGGPELVTKGALDRVLERCGTVLAASGPEKLDEQRLAALRSRYAGWSAQGYRVLGLAVSGVFRKERYEREDEKDLSFLGFLLFFDPPEPDVLPTLSALRRLGVQTTIITGDNQLVARHVAETVGMTIERIVTGSDLSRMRDEALWHLVSGKTLFAEVDPNQKERIINAYRRTGHVVGYIGDGINDVPALQAADVGISGRQRCRRGAGGCRFRASQARSRACPQGNRRGTPHLRQYA